MDGPTEDDLRAARSIRPDHLCDACLGRMFTHLWPGVGNPARGERLRDEVGCGAPLRCELCGGLMEKIEFYGDLVVDALSGWAYDTFLVGTRVERTVLAREEDLWRSAGRVGEPIKRELNREIGKRVAALTGRAVEFREPDMTAVVDTRYDIVKLDIRPLYVQGRYVKEARGIPQTRWMCTRCLGRGCERCGGRGRLYAESVEELIAAEFVKACGTDQYRFHGMGREDIDARMLGNGRPFILEMLSPRRRHLDLEEMTAMVNASARGKVKVSGLTFCSGREVEVIKSARFDKSYLVVVEAEGGTDGIEDAVSSFTGEVVMQRTPQRVSHRRADLVRRRRVVEARVVDLRDGKAFIRFRVNAGTYVKELVTGDGGRTSPSVSSRLGRRCRVSALDVIQVHDDGRTEATPHGR